MLSDHINAEVVSGTITSKQEAMDYITWTYFFRRLIMNPSYYDLDSIEHDNVNKYLSTVVQGCIGELEGSSCLEVDEVRCSFLCSKSQGKLGNIAAETLFPINDLSCFPVWANYGTFL